MANGVQTSQAALRAIGSLGAIGIRGRAATEERQERKATRRRGEKFTKQQSLGRLLGSAGGVGLAALLAPLTGGSSLALAGLVGAGSFAGQTAATAKTRRRNVDVGTFFKEQGQERERRFRKAVALEQLLGQAGQDALSAFSIASGPLGQRIGALGTPGAGLQAVDIAGTVAKNPLSAVGIQETALGSGRRLAQESLFGNLFDPTRTPGLIDEFGQFGKKQILREILQGTTRTRGF